ncbi:MAG TPA: permease [Desulfomonilaceae bacterium]|nr:permease [Desulfomonilaceae bacterium]
MTIQSNSKQEYMATGSDSRATEPPALLGTGAEAEFGPQATSVPFWTNSFRSKIMYLFSGAVLLAAWWLVYGNLSSFSRLITYHVLPLREGTHLGSTVEFFIFEVPKVLLLLTLIVFGVGIIRSYFTPERTRKILAGSRESAGHVLAALLGVVTPFCSCSAVPLFMGFLTAGVPLGVTFSFLVSAPMVNEVALVLLFGLFGWQVAALYMGTGLFIALVTGFVISRLRMERHLEDWVLELTSSKPEASQLRIEDEHMDWDDRVQFGIDAVKEIVLKVWPYVTIGIAVGAGIHGYVPENFLAGIMGKEAWWAVPVAVIIGIPMYSNAAGIIPVVQALLSKGAAFGTVLAFMMAVIAISTPEAIILRKVLKPRLIGVFIGVVTVGIIFVGYLFNIVL